MPTSFHRRVRQILEHAVRLEPNARGAFVRRTCGDNRELLEEVRSLLPHFEIMRDFEPGRPRGATLPIPGTTSMGQAQDEAQAKQDEDLERTPPFTIDRYAVEEVLGHGGMGVVYRAVHPTLHCNVAIKILRKGLLSADNRHRFTFEEEILRQLQHAGIARFVHSGVARMMPLESVHGMSDWRPYFVMEYVNGQSLTRFTAAHGLDVRQRLELFAKVCEAVEYAHRRGIIHRDLKPDNILVLSSGAPKVLDFGIAHIPALQSSVVRDREGQFTGTVRYASPEQLAGKVADLTLRSDVYTLGLILHELLAGRLPRREGTTLRLALRGVHADDGHGRLLPNEGEFRHYLTAILVTALRRSEEHRYRCAGELGGDVETLLAYFPVQSFWARLRTRVAGLFLPQSGGDADFTSRPLRAVLRKRIEMAIDTKLPDVRESHAGEDPAAADTIPLAPVPPEDDPGANPSRARQ